MIYKLMRRIFSRVVIIAALILVQIVLLVAAIVELSNYFVYWYSFCFVLSLSVVVWIFGKQDNPSYKLAWTMVILLFPIFGGLFYLILGTKRFPKKYRQAVASGYEDIKNLLEQDPNVLAGIHGHGENIAKQVRYIYDYGGFPIYQNTTTEYLTPGEMKFDKVVEELKKAKHYIFLEYFIIEEGVMWNTILEILKQKAQQGVKIRIMYDDIGCINTLPAHYYEKLRKMGIECCVFNPFKARLNAIFNNRDHRKILVIDGHTSFTGGINLADEYINEYEKHGYWKDASVMIKGDAVWSFTLMFLHLWNFTNDITDCDFTQYDPHRYDQTVYDNDGYVLPYADTPLDGETVGENVYLNLINNANDYIYITTPYLIIDNEFVSALKLAAKNGTDIRIITPHVPDKWYVHIMSQAFYEPLVQSGIRIFEFTPGFIHSKTFVVDDQISTVGTINLDFRSLYLHFECGVWMYASKAVDQVKQDFLKTLDRCQEITVEDCKNIKWYIRVLRGILRIFAPLM